MIHRVGSTPTMCTNETHGAQAGMGVYARVAEQVDAPASEVGDGDIVRVRLPSFAPMLEGSSAGRALGC